MLGPPQGRAVTYISAIYPGSRPATGRIGWRHQSSFLTLFCRPTSHTSCANGIARFLAPRIVHENEFISFISYDDEHHRVAFLNPGALAPREPGERDSGDFRAGEEAGPHHMAFTFKSLDELLDNYTRIKARSYG